MYELSGFYCVVGIDSKQYYDQNRYLSSERILDLRKIYLLSL